MSTVLPWRLKGWFLGSEVGMPVTVLFSPAESSCAAGSFAVIGADVWRGSVVTHVVHKCPYRVRKSNAAPRIGASTQEVFGA